MAQKTVQFRISQVYSNVDDMDGWGPATLTHNGILKLQTLLELAMMMTESLAEPTAQAGEPSTIRSFQKPMIAKFPLLLSFGEALKMMALALMPIPAIERLVSPSLA